MPGRGRPWRGVGEGNQDRIGTGAIADGSITEADLDSGVTSKLNSGSGYATTEDEGVPLTQRSELNFVGAGVVASDDGEKTIVTVAGGLDGHVIKDEGGVALPQRANLDFVGDGVVASDGIEDTTTITIAGGGGFDPTTTFRYFTDFMDETTSPIFDHFSTTGAGVVSVPGFDVETYGTMNMNSGGASGNNLVLETSTVIFTAGKDYTLKTGVKMDNTTDSIVIIGMMAGTPASGITLALAEAGFSDGAWFAFDSAVSANWLARTRDSGGSIQSTDTGVSANTSDNKFEIVTTRGVNSIFTINSAVVATNSTEVPSDEATVRISINTKVASAQDLELDYVLIEAPRT